MAPLQLSKQLKATTSRKTPVQMLIDGVSSTTAECVLWAVEQITHRCFSGLLFTANISLCNGNRLRRVPSVLVLIPLICGILVIRPYLTSVARYFPIERSVKFDWFLPRAVRKAALEIEAM